MTNMNPVHHSSFIVHHLPARRASSCCWRRRWPRWPGPRRRPPIGRRAGRHRAGGQSRLRRHEEQPLLLRPLPHQGREGNLHLHQPPVPCREAVERQPLRLSAGDHDRRGRLPVVGRPNARTCGATSSAAGCCWPRPAARRPNGTARFAARWPRSSPSTRCSRST